MINTTNKFCKYFPCHKNQESCAFCYCPFYPCLDKNLGKFVKSSKTIKRVWSCMNCSFIHSKKVTENIFNIIRRNKPAVMLDYKQKGARDAKTGVIVISHGSRVKESEVIVLNAVRDLKSKLPSFKIVHAYLQMRLPDLTMSINKLARMKCRRIIIFPFFLLNGNHVKRDIPEILKKETKKHSGIRFVFAKTISGDERITDIIAEKIMEASIK